MCVDVCSRLLLRLACGGVSSCGKGKEGRGRAESFARRRRRREGNGRLCLSASVRPFVKSVVLSAVKGLEVFVGGKEVQKY